MGRLLLSLALGGGLFFLVAWQLGYITPGDSEGGKGDSSTAKLQGAAPRPDLGNYLYPPAPLPPSKFENVNRPVDPIVVAGNMAAINKLDVPAPIPGQLMYVGEGIPEGAVQVAGVAAFLAEPFDHAMVTKSHGDVPMFYSRLYEGQVVYENQEVAKVDVSKILADIESKNAKIAAAKADALGAKAISVEAYQKYLTAQRLMGLKAGAEEEFRSAKLTWEKMTYDSEAKEEAVRSAMIEANVSHITYRQHEVRNKIPAKRSVIQKIYHQRGEAVKEMEAVMNLQSLDRLMAEAQVDAEFQKRIQDGMLVTIEPTITDYPPKTYRGHVAAVNCVAVTRDAKNPQIVSAGEDRTVMVWNRFEQSPVREFKHPEPVRALAVSSPGASHNLVLTGCADGSIRLFDLDAKEKPLTRDPAREHSVAITALAFSPDGKYFASGAADGSIILWNTAKFDVVYRVGGDHVDPHHGAVTALSFTPQSRLVSAALDNTVRVWSFKEKNADLDFEPLAGRAGTVGQLDVTADGKWLVFDQGRTLQLRSVADGRIVNTLQNPGGVIPFDTLALFSPDDTLMLTAGVGEGRLQLWRAPTESSRGFEIRQLSSRERAPVSCAAFAPLADYPPVSPESPAASAYNGKGSFAVSGNKDGQVYLWPLPSKAEVKNHPIKNVRVRLVTHSLNLGTRTISIGVEVPNPVTPEFPKGRLEPGRPVTIVIE